MLAGRKSGPGTGGGGKQEDGGGGTDLLGWLSGTFKSNKAVSAGTFGLGSC